MDYCHVADAHEELAAAKAEFNARPAGELETANLETAHRWAEYCRISYAAGRAEAGGMTKLAPILDRLGAKAEARWRQASCTDRGPDGEACDCCAAF